MNDLKIYHWTSNLIPGFIIILYIIFVLFYSGYFKNVDINDSILTTAFFIFVSSLLAYGLGAILWGIAYKIGMTYISLGIYSLFYSNLKKSNKEDWEKLRNKKIKNYQIYRIFIANKIIKNSKFNNYFEWRLSLLNVAEKKQNYIGYRLINQWEIIGLLQALTMVWGMLFFSNLFFLFYYNFYGIWLSLTIVTLLLYLGNIVAYDYRNVSIARDVAYAKLIMDSKK